MKKETKKELSALDQIADNAALKSDKDINRLITETEQTLGVLMAELKKRQADQQHKDIDNLDQYLEEADTSFKSLRNFITMALKEIRGE